MFLLKGNKLCDHIFCLALMRKNVMKISQNSAY